MKSQLQKHNEPKRKQHKKLTQLNSCSLTSPHNFQQTQPKRLIVKAHSEQKTEGITQRLPKKLQLENRDWTRKTCAPS